MNGPPHQLILTKSHRYGVGLGPFGAATDFLTVENRFPFGSANEYLVAPKGFTPKARPYELSDTYPVSAATLRKTIDKVVMRQPRISVIAHDDSANKDEYVQRSLIFRFPDVVTIQTIPLTDKTATVAVHSYSIYGGSDLGVNANRVKTWLAEISTETQQQ